MRILVAIDFSDVSRAVLDETLRLARPAGAELYLLHVAAADPDFVGRKAGPQSVRDTRSDELRREREQLDAWREELAREGLSCQAALKTGRTVERILEEAESWRANLLVVGSHGRSALYKALVGSVTENLLREASIPVLVIPPRIHGKVGAARKRQDGEP